MAFTPLNALNLFLVVARCRSFAAAAQELGISSSALSQSVRQLEQRLGVVLLSRTTRSVALTEAGRRLFEQAGPGVNQALEALKATSSRKGEVTGRIRLTVPEIAAQYLVTTVVPAFARRFPEVEVEVQVENRLIDIVSEGFDAGVRLEEFLDRDMVHIRLTEAFRFIVVGAPSYLERKGTPKKPKDLLTHDCICYRSTTTGTLYPWELEQGKKTWRIPTRGALTSNNDRAILGMAESGLGLAYVFEPLAAPQLKRGSLRLVLEPFAASVPGFFLYFPSRTQVSPAFRAFVDTAREVMPQRSR
ncbi:LysR family transcriptional regulator [Hyalangium versicolor]|uniref:LysR family transcriptional regulator n=1 Tax=Hyalangium versicolor TaxID=2861190 RepID=UPI001CC9FEB1|nr:LysR family transcriptional regulator [Hyalangium versicolor]